MLFNTKLDLATYGAIAEDIAAKFFDQNGMYAPHVGRVNAMCVFYNQCVNKESVPAHFPSDITNMSQIEDVANDPEFINAFNDALDFDGYGIDFAGAYYAAMDMVDTKKSSIGYMVDVVRIGIEKLSEDIESNLSPETLAEIAKIAAAIGDGSNLAEAIVEEYGKLKLTK